MSAQPTGFFRGRSKVRWGIIGCGDVTEVKSGPGFQKADGSELAIVMRRDGQKAADYARRHGVARWTTNAEELIHDPQVDAVYVATPPDSHAQYALAVAAAGKPAYVEKPMARHTPECDQMVEAFARSSLPLFVAYYRRCLPRFVEVRRILAENGIGRISGIRYDAAADKAADGQIWRVDPAVSGGGHLLDVGSHVIDLLDYLFGPLQSVAGNAANLGSAAGVEESVAFSFATEAGVPGVASWNFAAAGAEDRMVLSGTEGQLAFSVFGSEPIHWIRPSGTQEISKPHPPHVAQPLIQAVVDDLLGRGVCPSTGESARRASQVMDAVLERYYGGRADSFWLRPTTWPGRSTR